MIKKNILKMILLSVFIFTLLAGSALTAMASMSPGLMKAGSKTTFPAAFDLRTHGHVSTVRDSAGTGTGNWQKGWAFAVMASLESSYLRAGGTGDPDYSEMLLLYYCYIDQDETLRGFGEGTAGYPGALQTTGNATKATALLSRWTGIVNETDVLFGDRYTDNKPVDAPAVRRLHSVYYLDGGKINPGDVNVKQALTDHGAVVATVWGGGLNNGNYISPKNAYYIPTVPSGGSSEYYVAIVGWDDNYKKEDFSQANPPKSNGAWIVKTSDGHDTYNDGYIYISYEDATLEGGSAFVSVPADRYEFIYQHDVLGKLATVAPEGMADSTAWFANVFEPKEAFESLEAVSFYTLSADSEYEITVYTGVTGDPDTGTKEATQTGTIKAPGYHTVDLDEPQDLVKDRTFSVVVKLKTPGMESPVAIESYSDKENPRFEMVPGRSFLSANGATWSDTDTLTGTSKGYPCLKAFTKTRLPYEGKDFTEFSIPGQVGSVIDSSTHTVTVTMPDNTNTSSLAADFTLSGGASAKVGATPQVSGTTANNFNYPVTYTVTAEDGITQFWIVRVVLAAASPEVTPDEVAPVRLKDDDVSSDSGAKSMTDQETADLINGNDDLRRLFREEKVAAIIAVQLNGGVKDMEIPADSVHSKNVEAVGVEYEGTQTVTPVIAQIKSEGSSESMDKFDLSLPSEQISSLMAGPAETTLTFRFRVTAKESVVMFNGRNLAAENRASIVEEDELYYIVVVFSNDPEAGLTFEDLAGSVFRVETAESLERRILDRIHAKDYVYQDLINLGIQNLDADNWNEYKSEIDKLTAPLKEDIQNAVNAINAGEAVPPSGGGCSLGTFAPAVILLILPLMFLKK